MSAAAISAGAAGRGGTAGRAVVRTGLLVAASVAAGVAAGAMSARGDVVALLAFPVALVPVLVWRRPAVGPVLLLLGALAIEQSPYLVGDTSPAITDRIPLFHGTSRGSYADLLLIFIGLVWLLRTGGASRAGRRPPLDLALGAMLVAAAVALVVGRMHGGDFRIAVLEVRPYVYLAGAYLVAAALLDSRRALRAALWTLVLANGVKAVQGILIYLGARDLTPRPEAVLGHEQSVFFALSIVLTAALWLFGVPGRLRTVATALLPLVVLANMVNSRRTAWLILAACMIALAAIAYAVLPERRRVLLRSSLAVAAVVAVYLTVFWNGTGALAQPARAVHSAFAPDARDASSDRYRMQENANLALNVRQGGLLGKGFGVPIDYALPITDISEIYPLMSHIPHNGVLYVFMRLGVAGAVAFWLVVAFGIMGACRVARARDRELAMVGAVVACALIAYVVMGYNDQGFYFFRIALVTGTLLGLAEAAGRLDAAVPRGPRPATAEAR